MIQKVRRELGCFLHNFLTKMIIVILHFAGISMILANAIDFPGKLYNNSILTLSWSKILG